MSLKLNASGGGSVTLQEPTTASNVTLNLPAADGTVVYENASGNVGIGTSSPINYTNYKALTIQGANSTNGGIINLRTSGGEYALELGTNNNENYIFTVNNGALRLGTNNTERARIDSSGNLLVGTTVGGVGVNNTNSGTVIEAAGTVLISRGDNAALLVNTNGDRTLISCRRSSTEVGRISVTSTATAYNTNSDYRLKHDIVPMQNALATVAQLKPVTYKWNVDNSESQGFIAHELQAVVPDCVTGEKDAVDADGNPVYQGIDTSFLVATLTAAIQELKAEVDSLRAQVEAQ
jgi:hypothetical protein